MHQLAALGRNDLRSVRRDSLLVGVVLLPWLMVLGLRLIVPLLAAWVADLSGVDLVAYYPLLLSLFCILQIPLLFGLLTGFLMLDERDDDTLTALRVTPLSMTRYAAYRVGLAVLLSVGSILIATPLSGLMPAQALPSLVPIALVAGLFAPVIALLLAAFAGNKVEGMALAKGFGVFFLAPLAAYFVESDWQILLGALPTYWPAKAIWEASVGGAVWPYLLVGAAYQVLLTVWLLRRFQAKLNH